MIKKLKVGTDNPGIPDIAKGDIVELESVGHGEIKISTVNGIPYKHSYRAWSCSAVFNGNWEEIKESTPFKYNIGDKVQGNGKGHYYCDPERFMDTHKIGGSDCAGSSHINHTIKDRKSVKGVNWYSSDSNSNWYTEDALELVKTPKVEEFKTGDWLTVIKTPSYWDSNLGSHLKNPIGNIQIPFTFQLDGVKAHEKIYLAGSGAGYGWSLLSMKVSGQVRKATQEEIDKAQGKSSEFKVGDILVLLTHHNDHIWFKGRIFKVAEVGEGKSCVPEKYSSKSGYTSGSKGSVTKNIRLATSEEIDAYNAGFDTLQEYKDSKLTKVLTRKRTTEWNIGDSTGTGYCDGIILGFSQDGKNCVVKLNSGIGHDGYLSEYHHNEYGEKIALPRGNNDRYYTSPPNISYRVAVLDKTPVTVKEDLLEEAKRRFPIGTGFINKWMTTPKTVSGNYIRSATGSIVVNVREGGTYTLYENKVWAEIVTKVESKLEEKWKVGGYVRVLKPGQNRDIVYRVGDWAKVVEKRTMGLFRVHLFGDSEQECLLDTSNYNVECEWIGMEKPSAYIAGIDPIKQSYEIGDIHLYEKIGDTIEYIRKIPNAEVFKKDSKVVEAIAPILIKKVETKKKLIFIDT